MIKEIGVNKKARFEFELFDKYEAGMVLQGTEIKSLRINGVSFNDAYCEIKDNEVYVIGLHIKKYDQGNIFNHDPMRKKKLLLHKREIIKLKQKRTQDGYTLVPTKIYLKDGICKLELAVARGKKLYDKKESLKERDIKREHKDDRFTQ